MPPISRLFIANRGEIALRVIRACRDLGIESVLGASEADTSSLPARMADRVVCIGPARATDSYLKVETIVCAALGTRCQGVHPGYGFLAERPELAEACERNGLVFVGPSARCIELMGNKLTARTTAHSCGIPVIPGSARLEDLDGALRAAAEAGYPVMLKAAAGGGGRGMKAVWNEHELRSAFPMATAESAAAFGDGTLYLEHFVPNARHVEVQIAGDRQGKVIQLGERDCSVQRRYQKVIEEAPAYGVPMATRRALQQAAVALGNAIRYENVGTVEFIYDPAHDRYFFLEMNTRIQVEHPVTEMVTGVDLVKAQLAIAADLPLSIGKAEPAITGHAIECRITAEAPYDGFRPCPGRITRWEPPEGPHLRLDSHCYEGYTVPPYYESLIAKLIAWGGDRAEALVRMRNALGAFSVSGIETTIPFLIDILGHPSYVAGDVSTEWLEASLAEKLLELPGREL